MKRWWEAKHWQWWTISVTSYMIYIKLFQHSRSQVLCLNVKIGTSKHKLLEYDGEAVKKDRNIFILILFFESGEFVGETLISGEPSRSTGPQFCMNKGCTLSLLYVGGWASIFGFLREWKNNQYLKMWSV